MSKPNSPQVFSASNRRTERARSFQVIYSLSFLKFSSVGQLADFFQKSIYASPEQIQANDMQLTDDLDWSLFDLEAEPDLNMNTFNFENDNDDNIQIIEANEEKSPKGFAWDLVVGVFNNLKDIDSLISKFSTNWRIERLGKVELALLRIAMFELVFRDDVPVKVIMNESIELSKVFGDDNSRSFVNGILDASVKAINSNELQRQSYFGAIK